jgi:enoyl-[acyl-carrier-protein] reductase (NADH)
MDISIEKTGNGPEYPTLTLIHQNYSDMPRGQQRIADFVLKSPSSVVKCSISELAQQTGSKSESSIVRFYRLLGFKAYKDFKIKVAQELASKTFYHSYEDISAQDTPREIKRKIFNGAMLTLTYLGAVKAVPHYNVMGVAKAALEASVRYLAVDLGTDDKHIRVNAISAGPIRTLAAAGVSGFKAMHAQFKNYAPLRRNVTIDDVGHAALYLCSDWASGVTGKIHYVDAGFSVTGLPSPDEKEPAAA